MVKRFSPRVQRPFTGERTVFSTNATEKTGYPHEKKNETGLLPYIICKSKSKQIKEPWSVWLGWLECRPMNQKVTNSIPSQEACKKAAHQCFSSMDVSLFLSPSPHFPSTPPPQTQCKNVLR